MLERNWLLGEAFAIRSKHHESIKALWETKWRFPVLMILPSNIVLGSLTASPQCKIGVYPFHDGSIEDFEPVFKYLIKVCNRAVPDHPQFRNPVVNNDRRTISTTPIATLTPKPSFRNAWSFSTKLPPARLKTLLWPLRSTFVSPVYTASHASP